ncbi:transcription factor 23-like [Lissotriton helveticus]
MDPGFGAAGRGDLQGWDIFTSPPGYPGEDRRERGGPGRGLHPPKSQKRPEITTGHGVLKPPPPPGKQCPENAARERSRVRTLRQAFLALQAALPSVPPDTKLSKLDVLVLATSYIAHLTQTLDQDRQLPEDSQILKGSGYLHPMKKWPMRSRLYAGAMGDNFPGVPTGGKE